MCMYEFLTYGREAAGSDPGWCCRRWRLESGWRCIRPPLSLLFRFSETVAAVVGLPWFQKVWKPWQHTHYRFLSHTRALVRWCLFKGPPLGWDGLVQVFGTVQDLIQWLAHRTASLLGLWACMLPLNHNTPAATIHLRKKCTRYKIKGDLSGDSGILSKPTIRRVVDGGMSHSPVCKCRDLTQSHGNHSVTISLSNNRVPCTFKTAEKKMRLNRDNCLGRKRTQKPSKRKGS